MWSNITDEDIETLMELQAAVSKVDAEALDAVLRTRWSGMNYSERIWKNQRLLANSLRKEMTAAVHRGESIDAISARMAKRMDVGLSNARRLVRTELNYVHNHAALDSIEDSGMKYFRFIATLDKRTSATCRAHDGHVYPIEDAQQGDNVPPLHPHCRSTIAGSLQGEGSSRTGSRAARNGKGKTMYVPAGMTYDDWKAVYVDKSQTLQEWEKEHAARKKTNSIIRGQSYKPVIIDRNTIETGAFKGETVKVHPVGSSYAGGIYVDQDIRLKPRMLHAIEKHVMETINLLNAQNVDKLPALVVCDSLKMLNSWGAYNAATNQVFINIDREQREITETGTVRGDDIVSTYIHEFIHWTDAKEYERRHHSIDSSAEYDRYIQWIRRKGEKILAKLSKSGYNVNNISAYASQSISVGKYDEFYTEYRVLQVMEKKRRR